jgi:malonyl-CoA O-methyltransferase
VSQTTHPSEAQSSAPIDLRRVRKLFAAPERVADSGFLRREVAARMDERLALVKIAPRRMLDAGCGDGADFSMLQARFANAYLLGIDASPPMLRAAHDRQVGALSSINRMLTKWLPGKSGSVAGAGLVCSDFARLPLPRDSVDLVWSNLALHWHPQPDKVFSEWRRILKVDGLLMFSCFGPDTFKELRTAFATVDGNPHALPFVDMHDFGDMLVNVGFSTPVMDMETITVTYESVDKLISDVRAWGGNPLANQRRGLLGTDAWAKIVHLLEQNRLPDGRIPLTFEVVYGHAFRPIARKTASGEAIIQLDLHRK